MLKVGDRVKPHEDFDFDFANGPAGSDDVGTVTDTDLDIDWSPGAVLVDWDLSGETGDHCMPDVYTFFAVVSVEEG